MEKKTGLVDKIFIMLFFLHNLRFFNFEPYMKFWGSYSIVIDTILCFFFFIFFIRSYKIHSSPPLRAVFLMYLLFVFCLFNPTLQETQSLYYSLRGLSFTFLNFGFFYYLKYREIQTSFLFRLCWILLFLFIIVLIISYAMYPNQPFGYRPSLDADAAKYRLESDLEKRGTLRFNFLGGDLIALALFFVLSNFRKIKYGSLAVFALLILTLIRGTRGPIVSTVIVGIVSYIFTKKNKIKNLIVILIVISITFFLLNKIPFTQNIINSLQETTQTEFDVSGVENVRLLSLKYFALDFNQNNIIPIIFGNGYPMRGKYADIIFAANEMGLHQDDIEYLLWYVYFGIIGIIIFFYWVYTFLSIKVNTKFLCFKYFILYIIICMLLGSHFFRQIPLMAVISYILYADNLKYKIIYAGDRK